MHHSSGHFSLAVAIVHLLITSVSVLIVGKVLPGIRVQSFGSAVWFAFVVGVLNTIVWTVLWPLSIPFAIVTIGIGALILNGVIFMVADKFSAGVQISGCFTAILASIGVTILNWVFQAFIPFAR